MTLLDKLFHTPETQLSTTLAVGGTGYAITLNELIGILTVVLLTGQLGLLAIKYWSVISGWVKKRGTKE